MAMALPVSLCTVVGFALERDEGWVEIQIRLVLLVAVAVAAVWLLTGGFDVRHAGSPPSEVAARLGGVCLLAVVALFLTADTWVFAGESTNDVSASEQGLIAVGWLAALVGVVAYRLRSTPPPTAAAPGAAPAAGPGLVRRWPHLISALVIAGPLLVGEGLLQLLLAACGGNSGLLLLALLVVLSGPVVLPVLGLLLDRRRRAGPARAAGPAPGPAGFAVAFGTMALATFAHLGLLFVLLLAATAGYGVGTGTDC